MKLLITGAWNATPEQFDALRSLGHEVILHQQESDPLPCEYDDVEGCICNALFLHHPIEKFTSLRFIQLTSVGYDRVPMDYVKSHGIEIYNAQGVYSIPMAEFALCGVLQLYKQCRFFYKNQEVHRWEKHRGLLELAGKTVCVIGCGSVGIECAKRFAAFGCIISGVDIAEPQKTDCFRTIYLFDWLDEALLQSDIVILTLPLTETTHHLFNSLKFTKMKSGSVLVNISRGGIVDTSALVTWLNTPISGGAVLDVFEEEPLRVYSSLWLNEKTILTPHNSFVGEGNLNRMWEKIYTNLKTQSYRNYGLR